MLKRLLLSILTLPLCLSLYSETVESEFSYAGGSVDSYGTAKRETFNVAMCIDDPALKGMKITGIKAYINVADGISSPSLWLSSELKLEKKVNAPDIISVPVDVEPAVYRDAANGVDTEAGLLSVILDDPYTLTDQPVYVGYSVTIDNIDDEKHKSPLLFSKTSYTDGFYLHCNKTVIHWSNYSEKLGGAALIIVTLEREVRDNELGISTAFPVFAPVNEDFSAEITVTNTGMNPIADFSYTYSVDGGADVFEEFIELENPVLPDLMQPVKLSLPFGKVETEGKHEIDLSITEVNGVVNPSVANNVTIDLNVMPFVPKRRLLVEEYTGLWCKFCTRGYVGMELIADIYGDDQVPICYHNNDDMMVTSVYPMDVDGYPIASVDRHDLIDPYYGSHWDIDFGIRKNLEVAMAVMPIADIDVKAEIDGDVVNVETNTRFIIDVEDANYQVGYVLTCDGLSDPEWKQSNAYAGAGGLEGTFLEELSEWPDKVSGLVFNSVAVDVNGMIGIHGSLPASISLGEWYTHNHSYDIGSNKLIKDRADLVAAAFIIDKNDGTIINANKYYLNGKNSVDVISSGLRVVEIEYYDLNGRKLSNPCDGIFIRRDRMSDGTFRTYKIVR